MMYNEPEKLTINLSVVELAQIDVLAEQGLYLNRSDFIRTAVRKHLATYKDNIENQLLTIPSKINLCQVIGILTITKKLLEKHAEKNEKVNISVIGMLIIGNDISTALFEKAVDNVTIRGKLSASDDIKEVISRMN